MQAKLKLALVALCCAPAAFAQTPKDDKQQQPTTVDESAFTFTEAQLGENDNMSQNVTIINSASNLYASQVGYLFSPTLRCLSKRICLPCLLWVALTTTIFGLQTSLRDTV